MKKIVMAICGVVVFCWGVASLRSGALKADNLLQESAVVETTVPESSTVVEPTVPESVAPAPAKPVPTPEQAVPAESAATEAPAEQAPEESTPQAEPASEPATETSTVEPSESESTTSESSTSGGTSSESSTSGTSTSQTSSTTSSSTSTSGTSTSSSTSTTGSTTSSSTGGSTGTTTTSSSTVSSASQEPTQPSTPPGSIQNPVPNTPTPAAPSEPAVQTSTSVIQETPDAFSATSTLQLPSDLKTAEVAQSDLKGYELPLLSSFENKAHAALIYDGIKKLGIEQKREFDVEQLAAKLYSDLFAIEITGTPEKQTEEISVGSLLYQKKKDQLEVIGVYIGKDYYLTVEDVEAEASEEATAAETAEDTESDTNNTEENTEESDEKEKQRQVVLQPLDIDEELLVQALPNVTLTEYGETILKEYPASINFTENESSKKFISTIAEDARKLGQEYDVFASVMIAQALLESGSGSSSLSLPPNYNLFGVKGTYQGQAVSMATQEDRGNGELYSINSAFRKYPNYTASLGDYVQLLRGGISGNDSYYQKTWRSTAKNYLRSTHALTGTYATDTSYDKKLNSIIAVYNLTQYDRVKVDQSSGVFIKGKDEIPEEYRSMMRYPDYNGVNYNTSGSYPVGQCTWYAFNRVKQLGKSVDDFMGNGGEWGTKGKALGHEVSREPKVGWLISFTPGTAGSDPRYGHVAFVEVVRPEGILISEGNVYGGTVISYRVIDANLAKSDLVTYIKAK